MEIGECLRVNNMAW